MLWHISVPNTGCLFTAIDVASWNYFVLYIYRVIHKSFRDFRPLRYRSQDDDTEGERVNRGGETPSFCPALQVLDMSILVTYRAADKHFLHLLDSLEWWPWPVCSIWSVQAATLLEFHVPLTNCFVCRWSVWYTVWNLPLHNHNWLSLANSKTQNAFLFAVHAMLLHKCPLVVKPASTPWHLVRKKTWERFSSYWYAAFCCVCLGCCAAEFRSSGGIYELSCVCVCIYIYTVFSRSTNPASYVFRYLPSAILGPELSPI
jgi:hypothetical protein